MSNDKPEAPALALIQNRDRDSGWMARDHWGEVPDGWHPDTDLANVHRLIKLIKGALRVVDGTWHAWDGSRWVPDKNAAFLQAVCLSYIVWEETHDERERLRSQTNTNDVKKTKKEIETLEAWGRQCEMQSTINTAVEMTCLLISEPSEGFDFTDRQLPELG